jgi:hypothetical protein
MNFEKSTGYITIPDSQVVYTKLNEDADQLGGIDASAGGNEGQKLVWGLQDLKTGINEKEVEAPQLLPGFSLADEDDDRVKGIGRKHKVDHKAVSQAKMVDKFEEQRKQDRQTLFREREVQSLRDLIYGKETAENTEDDELVVDTNRYDVHP